MKLRKFLFYFFLGANFVFVLLFLLSCLAPFISPEKMWPLAFLGLSFPALFLINIFWILFWLLFSKKWALLPLAAVLLSVGNLFSQFSWPGCTGEDIGQGYTVMSYNVKNFDLYNWSHNSSSREAMLQLINKENPDILCLQEFYTDNSKDFNILKRLHSKYAFVHFETTYTADTNNHWGIATFSKLPILNQEVVRFKNARNNLGIASDVLIGEDTIRVINAHLQSIHFGTEEYKSLENLGKETRLKLPISTIFKKLKTAFIKRANQAEILSGYIQKSPLKVVVCADFNDSPNSYAYRIVSQGLNDSFKEAGCGLGRTYAGPFPSFRIDFILTDKAISVHSHEVIKSAISDHYPIVSRFTL